MYLLTYFQMSQFICWHYFYTSQHKRSLPLGYCEAQCSFDCSLSVVAREWFLVGKWNVGFVLVVLYESVKVSHLVFLSLGPPGWEPALQTLAFGVDHLKRSVNKEQSFRYKLHLFSAAQRAKCVPADMSCEMNSKQEQKSFNLTTSKIICVPLLAIPMCLAVLLWIHIYTIIY